VTAGINCDGTQETIPAVLQQILSEGKMLCPSTGIPLTLSRDGLVSSGSIWKIKNRSVDLYDQYRGDVPEFRDIGFARQVAQSLSLGDERLPEVLSAISDTALVADDSAYTAEIAELADRLGIDRAESPARPAIEVDNSAATLSILDHYLSHAVPAGARIKRSVRIKNEGAKAFNSLGDTPVYISYHWLDASGTIIEFDGLRSPIPIDLSGGSSITIICDINTPAIAGEYQLQFQAVIEGLRWMEEATLDISVRVEGQAARPTEFEYTSNSYSYAEEHAIGLYMIGDAVQSFDGTKRILEIGGGIHPQSNALTASDCVVISIDISSPMSQLGQLYFDHATKNDRIAFITCDAHEPPFAAGTFDCAAIFSALHHFAEPVRLLSNLRKVVKDGGFIAIMCEPCEPERDDPMYLRDLRKGINEQIWTVEEYLEIFRRSKLRVRSGRVDGGSLKAILVAV
jgi:SAM-dependent methyltransferase